MKKRISVRRHKRNGKIVRAHKRKIKRKPVKRRMAWAKDSGFPFADHPDSYGYEGELIMMDPDDFLEETRKQSLSKSAKAGYPKGSEWIADKDKYREIVLDKKNVLKLSKLIKDPSVEIDQPYLEYGADGEVKGHEGRHRASAAIMLGQKKIPVRIVRFKIKDES